MLLRRIEHLHNVLYPKFFEVQVILISAQIQLKCTNKCGIIYFIQQIKSVFMRNWKLMRQSESVNVFQFCLCLSPISE